MNTEQEVHKNEHALAVLQSVKSKAGDLEKESDPSGSELLREARSGGMYAEEGGSFDSRESLLSEIQRIGGLIHSGRRAQMLLSLLLGEHQEPMTARQLTPKDGTIASAQQSISVLKRANLVRLANTPRPGVDAAYELTKFGRELMAAIIGVIEKR